MVPLIDTFIKTVNDTVLARAREHPKLADKIWMSETNEGDPSPLPLPYIMIFADNGQRTDPLMSNTSAMIYFNYTVHYVGETRQQVDALADAFYKQWDVWRPVIPGIRSFKMKANFSTPDNTNDAIKPPLLYRVDEWGLRMVKGKGFSV